MLAVVSVILLVVVAIAQQQTTINIVTACNGHCTASFGQINNSTCPKLQAKIIATPFNCQNRSCAMSLSVSADSLNLNFSIDKSSAFCDAHCGGVFVPFDIVNALASSVCCGSGSNDIKARTAVDYICSELYTKTWQDDERDTK